MQPDELSVDCTGMVNKTAALVLEGKYPSEIIPFCATSEMYEGTPIFIPVDITEEAIESVAQKLLGSSGSGGTDSEALQGWLLNFGEDITILHTSVETFVDWLANGILPWSAYRAFMSGRLIALDKQTGVRPVGVGEMWRHIFSKIVLKVT